MRALIMNIFFYEILNVILSFSAFLAQIFSLLFCCEQNPWSVFSIKARDHVQARREYEGKISVTLTFIF
jgi:hypothetical protein